MQHGEYGDRLGRRPKIDGVRKRVKQRSPNIPSHSRELEWPLADATKRTIDIAEKPARETGLLFLVPSRGIVEVGLGERPNDEAAGH